MPSATRKNKDEDTVETVELRRKKGFGPHTTPEGKKIKPGESWSCPKTLLPRIEEHKWDFPSDMAEDAAPIPVVGMTIEHYEDVENEFEESMFNVRNDDTGNLVNDVPLVLEAANALIKESQENK